MKYKTNNNVCYSSKYHVVWCTKYRRYVISDDVEQRLKEISHEVCRERKADLIEIECEGDHVHILLEVDPQYGIHRLVKQIKGRTSKLLRAEFPSIKSRLPTLWTNSYFVSTVGGAPIEAIKKYIQSQKMGDIR